MGQDEMVALRQKIEDLRMLLQSSQDHQEREEIEAQLERLEKEPDAQ